MIVVSGMRPTGPLHLGHLEGVLRNWVRLQEEDVACFFFVADLHALTDHPDPDDIRRYTLEMLKDWLAVGLDPDRSTLFVQSQIPEHAELANLLGMSAPVSWLERCPTYKDRVAELGPASAKHGLLTYPILMAADVALYGGEKIPVGEDQVAHLELAREVIRAFNRAFPGSDLVEPRPLLISGTAARLAGTDGRKMSKSYDNAIEISAGVEALRGRVKDMLTDPARKRRQDPGDPAKCNLYPYHEIYTSDEAVREKIRADCRSAAMGCVDCKKILAGSIETSLGPIWERRKTITDAAAREAASRGAARARARAHATMERVRRAVGIR